MDKWLEAISVAVAEGRTKSQFAIPDGIYIGDLFFVTNSKNKIIRGFVWTGKEWISEYTVMRIQNND